jgi:branched-chain amino acid transport system substrate-binding protein
MIRQESEILVSSGKGISRRTVLKRTAAAAVAGGVTSLAAPFIGSVAADEPVKLGLILAKQGPFAQQGADLAVGVQIALKQASNLVMGRQIEMN